MRKSIKKRADKVYDNLIASGVSEELAYAEFNGYYLGATEQRSIDHKELPPDDIIMKILNCIGYEEQSWVDTVKQNWNKIK